jgi:hypothetical protein
MCNRQQPLWLLASNISSYVLSSAFMSTENFLGAPPKGGDANPPRAKRGGEALGARVWEGMGT